MKQPQRGLPARVLAVLGILGAAAPASPPVSRPVPTPSSDTPLFTSLAGESDPSIVRWDPAALAGLRAGPPSAVLTASFPLPSGEVLDLELRPLRVAGPKTRFVEGRRDGEDVVLDFDPAQVALLHGRVAGHPHSDVYLALGERLSRGFIDLGPGAARWEVISFRPDGERLAVGEVAVVSGTGRPSYRPDVPLCGWELAESEDAPIAEEGIRGIPMPGIQHLEIALETDYELFELFGDTADTLTYLMGLFGAVNHVYLRDVNTYFEITYVRLWTTPDDLFNEPNPFGPFSDYWNANMGSVHRDVAQLVSGRRDLPYGGVAALGALCPADGYSVVGYLAGTLPDDPLAAFTGSYDISVVAHELGHNCGSPHTPDYDPPIDRCYPPPTVYTRGEIMSYCSQTVSGADYVEDIRFTTRVRDLMRSVITGSACVNDDCNLNGAADSLDILFGTSADANGNVVPDECEDCNGNGILDSADIIAGTSQDVDGGGIPDECEPDCNGNGIPDARDIFLNPSLDRWFNGVPDSCDPDCDNDGSADYNELQANMPLDINRNLVLDACEDCDGDGTLDAVELAGAHSTWVASAVLSVVGEYHAITGVRVRNSASVLSNGGGQDVLVLPDGRVLVSSGNQDRVYAFNPTTGASLGPFVTTGSGGLDYPTGMTLGPNGNLFVSSFSNGRILEYNGLTGAFVRTFVASGANGPTQPFGLAFGPSGNLYVACDGGRVREYNGTSGAFVRVLVDFGDNGGLSLPRGLTFNADGHLLVASYGSFALLEFDGWTGGFRRVFNNGGALYGPWGVRVGPNGHVFVTRDFNARNHVTTTRIYEFNGRTGNLVRSYLIGDDTGLNAPTGFAFAPGWARDCNVNARPDNCDIAGGGSADANANGTPDECEADCNANGTPDRRDIAPYGNSLDCNFNRVPDECELTPGEDCNLNGRLDECETDCNVNGVPDECDIAQGTSLDCASDGTPDECESDCNTNGLEDDCEVTQGSAVDCNANLVPDECESPADCNWNGVRDFCDIVAGTSVDCNANTRPDECELAAQPDIRTFLIFADGLVGMIEACGSGFSSSCTVVTDEGIQWLDPAPDVVTHLKVELNVGRNCHPTAMQLATSLNGTAGPIFRTTQAHCSCEPTLGSVATFDFSPASYLPGGLNTLRLTNTPTCFGLAPRRSWNGAYARVTVTRLGDCNQNGTPDDCDLDAAVSIDSNQNGRPDECDDCNGNGFLDDVEVAAGTSPDCNRNETPDECEGGADCNANGSLDECDLAADRSNDCNGNRVPDECDIAAGTSQDADADGVADECAAAVCSPLWTGFEATPPFSLGAVMHGLDLDGDGWRWDNPSGYWSIVNPGCAATPAKAMKAVAQSPPTGDQMISEFFAPLGGGLDCGAAVWSLTFDARSEALLNPRVDWQMTLVDGDSGADVILLHWASTQSFYAGVTAAQGGNGRGRLLVKNPAGSPVFINSGFAFTPNTCYQVRVKLNSLTGQVQLFINGVLRVTTTSLAADCRRMDFFRVEQVANGQATGGPNRLGLDNFELCRSGAASGWADCNGNCVSDAREIAAGEARDCNANGSPDACDLAAGLLADVDVNGVADGCVTAALSRKVHGALGARDLPVSPAGRVEKGNVSTEPRAGGVSELRLSFDGRPGAAGQSPVTVMRQTCGACPCDPGAPASYATAGIATSSAVVQGRDLVLTFSPGLPGPATYRLDLGTAVTGFTGGSVEVRSLLADVNGDARVNATDRSTVVAAWTGAGFSAPTDVNLSGSTDAGDRSIVVGQWTGAAGCAP